MTFADKYPVASHELIHYALMFADSLKEYRVPGIQYARLDFVYDFAESFGISKGTVRTNLSRMKKDGYVESVGNDGTARYRVSALQLETMRNVMKRKKARAKGYKIAVYSFERSQEKARLNARSILEYAGFVRFAQNAFVNSSIDDRELRKSLDAAGVGENVFIFDVPRLGDAETAALARAWNVGERARFLSEFFDDLRSYLPNADDDAKTSFGKLGYAWVAFIMHVYMTEPPFPEDILPHRYDFDGIYAFLKKQSMSHGMKLMRYYRDSNK
jgi:DNA-binding transcriptional regulator PaaX